MSTNPPSKLPIEFYRRSDVAQIGRELLGKVLCTRLSGNHLTSGIITETEAYSGRNDKASHANEGSRTDRTEIMYAAGGVAYVYLCYGIHHLFNVVTNKKSLADAVLIRAIEPVEGIERMQQRREIEHSSPVLTAGPGRLTEALGIKTDHYGTGLTGDKIWIENRGIDLDNEDIQSTPRIGVDYAGEDAARPWRFVVKNSFWLSR